MTSYNFGDVVLVPFPFTDQRGTKKRPAVVVSSARYNNSRRDLILVAVTSQISRAMQVGDVEVSEWEEAGLLKPSVIKPILTTENHAAPGAPGCEPEGGAALSFRVEVS